jgi:putative endonuclease
MTKRALPELLRRLAGREPAGAASATTTGEAAESRAAHYLEHAGLTVLARNYRSPFGEIDLIMEQAETVVFVEVRYRARADFGTPAETVGGRKQARLRATAEHFLQHERQASNRPCRFDIVAIFPGPKGEQFEWLRNAF